jgi:peptide deformylase
VGKVGQRAIKMVLELVKPDHPLLRTKLTRFDFNNPPTNPHELANDLIETMVHYKGIGLSANQCGLPYRVFVLWSNPTKVMFNPVIADVSTEELLLEEGCLTYPNLFVKIKRPKLVRVRYMDSYGDAHTDKFTGISARCVLHEVDHLNGEVYLSKANKFHYDQAMRQRKKYKREYGVPNENQVGGAVL